jgi:hypothetical protein
VDAGRGKTSHGRHPDRLAGLLLSTVTRLAGDRLLSVNPSEQENE